MSGYMIEKLTRESITASTLFTVASPGNLRTGGGITNSANSTVNIINTIIDGNSAANGGPDCYGTLTSGDFNLISNTADCTIPGTNNSINQSAQLEPLAFNGGPTWDPCRAKDQPGDR